MIRANHLTQPPRLRSSAVALGLATSLVALATAVQAQEISFWTQPQGDILVFSDLMDDLTGRFRDETGIQVKVDTINSSNQFTTWLTVAQGGAAPDCADMYWLHSFAGIGAGQYGPMPITEYLGEWPTLREDFYESTLADVFWKDEFYGIPWRVDVRSFLYRTDFFAEAGLDKTPTNWVELVEAGKALTVRNDSGSVTRWGYAPGNNSPAQVLYPLYWQAGGEFLSEDGWTATIDNEAMRTALKFMQDLVHVHKITSPEIFEKSSDPLTDFTSGNVAMNGSVLASWPAQFDRDYPEIEGLWALGEQPSGPEGQAAFMGGGCWGVLHGTQNVKACVEWIKFLSSPENMEQISRVTGVVSPLRAVMSSELWSDEPWKAVLADTVNYGHTSQQPSSVWAAIAAPEPGAVLYDLVYSTVIGNADIDAAVTQAQTRLQAELDRANSAS